MLSQKQVIAILQKYVTELKKIYGKELIVASLFGSYARGDFNEDSDIDIALILDMPEDIISSYDDKLGQLTFQFNVKYDIDIEPVTINKHLFQKWMMVHPFYKNICEDGVVLYELEAA